MSTKRIENSDWLESGYHDSNIKECPFKNDTYYHLGVYYDWLDEFIYQGIYKYYNGFKDNANYYLRPFPTHYIEIETPKPLKIKEYGKF